MYEPKANSVPLESQFARPGLEVVIVSKNDGEGRTQAVDFLKRRLAADISEMPDFVGVHQLLCDCIWKMIMCVGYDGYLERQFLECPPIHRSPPDRLP